MNDKKKASAVKTILRILPIQIKTVPVHTSIELGISIFHAMSFALTVVATQRLFDEISKAANGNATFTDCLIPLAILAGVTFASQILNGVHNFYAGAITTKKSSGKLMTILQKKVQRIDPALFENTDFLDDLNKAKEATGQWVIPFHVPTIYFLVFFYGVYFATIGIYLFSLKPLLLIILLIAFLPSLFAQIIRIKIFTKLEDESAPLRREFEYYQKTICDREYFKETRILGAYKYFHKLFSDTLIVLTEKIWKAERKTALLQLSLNITSFAGMAIASYLLFAATMSGEITVGAFAAVFASLGMLFGIMEEIISSHLSNLNKNIGKIANFLRVIDMPERAGLSEEPDYSKGIIADGICFTYPGRDEPAVKNVSLSIKDGETIAIVGENGAGKSTLVRLLTGVYHPSEGKVIVGGLDTCETAPLSIFENISGVFQKYQRYKMTLSENVTISDPKSKITETEIITDIDTALSEAHFETNEIEYDTMLSPEFDGIDLSGGQWQRLAIARGLFRKNDFIVLDEPTAAIDPIEETRVYTQFQKLAEGKCAVIVTHRLGSAKLAHRIIVMDAGEIVDSGTHDELITRKGKYADMWSAQSQWYEREPDMV